MKDTATSKKKNIGQQKCPVHNCLLVQLVCPVTWYTLNVNAKSTTSSNSEGSCMVDDSKVYVLQLGEHSHHAPLSQRPPNFISAGIKNALVHAILDKGKRNQLSHAAMIDSIVDQHGQYYLNKDKVLYDKTKWLNAFYPDRNDIITITSR